LEYSQDKPAKIPTPVLSGSGAKRLASGYNLSQKILAPHYSDKGMELY